MKLTDSLLVILLLPYAASAQNTWSVISGHPRLLINDTITDTWEPAKTRLAAIEQRVMGGNATATSDFAMLLNVPGILPTTSGSCTASGAVITTSGTGASFFYPNMNGQSITVNGSSYTVSGPPTATTAVLTVAPASGA